MEMKEKLEHSDYLPNPSDIKYIINMILKMTDNGYIEAKINRIEEEIKSMSVIATGDSNIDDENITHISTFSSYHVTELYNQLLTLIGNITSSTITRIKIDTGIKPENPDPSAFYYIKNGNYYDVYIFPTGDPNDYISLGKTNIDLEGVATEDWVNENFVSKLALEDYAKKTDLDTKADKSHTHNVSDITGLFMPTKVSQLENDSKFITSSELTNTNILKQITKEDLTKLQSATMTEQQVEDIATSIVEENVMSEEETTELYSSIKNEIFN